VIANGKLIFSKAAAGRFPNDGEVERVFVALKEGKEPPPLDPPKKGIISRLLGK